MSNGLQALVLSGGVAHDFEETSARLVDVLVEVGVRCDVDEEVSSLARPGLANYDLVVLNCVRWSCAQNPNWREWEYRISEAEQDGLLGFLRQGKGLMALHAATINFDAWPEYAEVLGGRWEWEQTGHGPYQPGWRVHVVDREHPITRGVDDFEIHDELYHTLTITRHVHVLMTCLWGGRLQPMAWVQNYGGARVHYNALGHGVETFENPSFRKLLQQGALWTARQA